MLFSSGTKKKLGLGIYALKCRRLFWLRLPQNSERGRFGARQYWMIHIFPEAVLILL